MCIFKAQIFKLAGIVPTSNSKYMLALIKCKK